MAVNVLAKTLRERRRGFVWWSLGIVAFVAMYASVYPSVRGQESFNELIENYPEALRNFFGFGGNFDIVSGPGYLGAELFSFVAPLIFLALAIGAGAAAIAGEEERGTLDLLMSAPLGRSRCLLEKLAALALELVALAIVLWVSLTIAVVIVDMGVSASNLAAATIQLLLLALVFGTLSLAIGAASGRRALAIGVASGLAVAAYVITALAPLAGWLNRVRLGAPYYFYSRGDPLRDGLAAMDAVVLLALALAFSIAAPLLFRRRDLGAP